MLAHDGSSWRATPALGNDEYDWSCLFAGPILLVVPNRVLKAVANGIETNYHWLDIASLEYQIRIRIGRVGALEPYFKLWIMMAFRSPLKGATLLTMVRKRRVIGIGNCDDCTQRSIKLTLGCHSSSLSGRSYAVGIAKNPLEMAEFDRIARKTYSTDVECRQLSCAKRLVDLHPQPAIAQSQARPKHEVCSGLETIPV